MSWIKICIVTLGLLICASPAAAAKIERFTDSEGTVHITNPGTDENAPAAHPKIPPRSHRTINPYASPEWPPRPIRPSPYLQTDDPPANDTEAPTPVEIQKPQPAPGRPESPAQRLLKRRR